MGMPAREASRLDRQPWNTMSHAVAPQVMCGCIPGTCTFTRALTVPCFVFTRTVRVTVTAFGVPSTIGSVALPTEPRAGYTPTAPEPGVPIRNADVTNRAIQGRWPPR